MSGREGIRPEQVCGSWSLVSALAYDARNNVIAPPYGPKPMGCLVLTPAGRMMAILCDGRNVIPEGEVRAYSSYCGNYRLEGDRLITKVDAAAITSRLGSEQIRRLYFRDGCLVLMPPRRPDGEQRELYWKRSDAGQEASVHPNCPVGGVA